MPFNHWREISLAIKQRKVIWHGKREQSVKVLYNDWADLTLKQLEWTINSYLSSNNSHVAGGQSYAYNTQARKNKI